MTVAVAQPRSRAPHTRTAVFGLLTIAVAFTIPLIGTKFTEIGFIGPFMAVALLVAVLAWRFGTWSKVLATVIGIAMFLMNAPFVGAAFVHPSVFFEFVPSVLFAVGALTAAVGGIVAVVKRRDHGVEATSSERTIRRASIAVFVLVAAISAALSLAARTTLSASEKSGGTQVGMRNFAFEPDTFEVAADRDSKIVLHNSDVALHTFTIAALGVDVPVTPGSDAIVEFDNLPAGTYSVYCKPHSTVHPDGTAEGMTATLIVR